MKTDSIVLAFQHPDEPDDPLTSILRDGARRLLAEAIEAEVDAFVAAMREARLSDGRARLVRHGHGPEDDPDGDRPGPGQAGSASRSWCRGGWGAHHLRLCDPHPPLLFPFRLIRPR